MSAIQQLNVTMCFLFIFLTVGYLFIRLGYGSV